MNRRTFLARASGMGMTLALGGSFWERALAAPAQPGASPYGELLGPDANGLQLPPGFTSRVVARALQPVAGTGYVWHPFPDGGACLPTGDGGWVYVSNSENPPPAADVPLPPVIGEGLQSVLDLLGGVSVIRFAPDGAVVEAYRILQGSRSNCAGGLTPWGTWLSCEEWEAPAEAGAAYTGGRVFECDPFARTAVVRPSLGIFKHEMAAVDPERQHVYLSEDQDDGLLYRYTPPPGTWGSGAAFEGGTMEAMAVAPDGTVTWVPVPNASAPAAALRTSVPGATPFNGGEGLVYDEAKVYLTTKGDDRVWVHDVVAQTMAVLYDAAEFGEAPVLDGVDNIIASAAHDLYVAEDGGNMEVNVITSDLVVAPVVRLPGPEHGQAVGPIPSESEVTGLAFSPDGNRLYLNSQRGGGFGILYEVTGPWRGGTLAAQAGPSGPSAPSAPSAPSDPGGLSPTTTVGSVAGSGTGTGGTLARTGAGASLGWTGAAAAAAAGALWRLRRRLPPTGGSSPP